MTNSLSNASSLDPDTGFTPLTSVSQAANDLRAAAGEKARELAHNVGTQASTLKERAIEGAQHFREVASEKVGEIKHSAAERAQRLQESAAGQWRDTRVLTKEFHVTAEDYIRQNPTKCVVGALGLGVLIGLIVRR
ncbi:MAG: hypothetical protein DVB25_02120 [Verrucomicrobia bacterium]|nr:MAG: hypothetical protein DVB25_02120 [Verrucomicrobiota bacterium]